MTDNPSPRLFTRRWLLAVVLVVAGCTGLVERELGEPDEARAPNWSQSGEVPSATGCQLSYRVFAPAVTLSESPVVLGHGFLRSQDRLVGLATALAEAGVLAVTVDFCNTRLWNGAHVQNGRDLVTVVRHLGLRSVVYGGFSAGALAAVVAASQDRESRGVLALDLVDDRGLAQRTVAVLDRPLHGIMGEPSACNADGNGVAALTTRSARLEHIAGAGHCDFESPTDWLCRLVCPSPPGWSPERRTEIIEASVAAALRLTGALEHSPAAGRLAADRTAP